VGRDGVLQDLEVAEAAAVAHELQQLAKTNAAAKQQLKALVDSYKKEEKDFTDRQSMIALYAAMVV